MAVLRRVETGSASLAANSASLPINLTTAALDLTKSFVLTAQTPLGSTPTTAVITPKIGSTSQFTITRQSGTSAPAQTVSWQFVEFTSGVTVQPLTISTAGTSTSTPITAVDLTKAFPIAFARASSGTIYTEDDFPELDFTSSTSLRTRFGLTATDTVEAFVIEYANCNVQSGRVSFTSTDLSLPGAITAVNPSKTLLIFSYQIGSGNNGNIGQKLLRGKLTDATTITFTRQSTGCAMAATYYAIEFSDNTTVYRGSYTFGTSELTSTAIDVGAVLDLSKAAVFIGGWHHMTGSSAYSSNSPGVAAVNPALSNPGGGSNTQLTLTRGLTGSATATIEWQVVVFDAGSGSSKLLYGSIASPVNISASLQTQKRVSGSIAPSTSIAAALQIQRQLLGSIAPQTTVAASLQTQKRLSGQSSSQIAISASLQVQKLLPGSIAASSSLAIALQVQKRLSGVIAPSTNIAVALQIQRQLTGQLSAQVAISGQLQTRKQLLGAIASPTSISASILIANASSLAASISAASRVSASLAVQKPLSSTIASPIHIAIAPIVDRPLTGSILSGTVVGARLQQLVNLRGTVSISTVVQSGLIVEKRLSGAIAPIAQLSASLDVSDAVLLTAGLNALGAIACGLRVEKNLSSSVAAGFSSLAELFEPAAEFEISMQFVESLVITVTPVETLTIEAIAIEKILIQMEK